jgi:type IV secretory pathway VirB3-like protein
MDGLERDSLFVALTRPQMFAGVTYGYFIFSSRCWNPVLPSF